MRIFITGGAGFIGTHLCKKLILQNHNVTVYDNFSNSSKESITSTLDNNSKIISGDVLDFPKLVRSMENHDIVIHLAAKTSVLESISNTKLTFDTNVKGTQNVLNSCTQNNISKIIVTSTAAVYQSISEEKLLDEKSPTEPLSSYGQSKQEMEKIVNEFVSQKKIHAIILRLFNVYGNGQSLEYAGVISKFKERIDNNLPLIIFGDGTATRDFIYVDDVIDVIIQCINSSNSSTYNIATGIDTSISDLAKMMIELSGKDLKIIYKPSRDGEILYSCADISHAKTNLNFTPSIPLKTGLKQFFCS